MMEIAYPPQMKKAKNMLEDVKFKLEAWAQTQQMARRIRWIVQAKKDNLSLDENKILGWFDRNKFTCCAIQLPQTTEELALLMKKRLLRTIDTSLYQKKA